MLEASPNRRFWPTGTYEVSEAGKIIAKLNILGKAFDLAGSRFEVVREGFFGTKYTLKCGDAIVATVTGKSLLYGGREWEFKSIGWLNPEFGLFGNGSQVGAITGGSFPNRLRGITINVPEDFPQAVQLFLLLIVLREWTSD